MIRPWQGRYPLAYHLLTTDPAGGPGVIARLRDEMWYTCMGKMLPLVLDVTAYVSLRFEIWVPERENDLAMPPPPWLLLTLEPYAVHPHTRGLYLRGGGSRFHLAECMQPGLLRRPKVGGFLAIEAARRALWRRFWTELVYPQMPWMGTMHISAQLLTDESNRDHDHVEITAAALVEVPHGLS